MAALLTADPLHYNSCRLRIHHFLNPSVRVLLMAMFAGASAGAVSGEVFLGEIGEIFGQVAGILLGGIAWAIWLFVERSNDANQQHPQDGVA